MSWTSLYSFKNSEFKTAVEFYILDLSFNPDRLDSWIAMSLSKANTVEEKGLNSIEIFSA